MLTALGVMTSLSVRLSSRCAFNTVTGVYELRGSFFQSKKSCGQIAMNVRQSVFQSRGLGADAAGTQ
jgi:hypothetical protein